MQARANRYSIRRPVEYTLRTGRGATKGRGRTVNISSGGILFKTDDELTVGGRIELIVKLGLADDSDTYVTLFAQGVTVRCDDGGTAVSVKKHRLRPLPAGEFKLR